MPAFGSLPHRRAPARPTARPATNQRARCAQPRDRPTDGPTHTPDRPQTDQPTSRPADQPTSRPADHRRLSFFLCETRCVLVRCVLWCFNKPSAGSCTSRRWFAWQLPLVRLANQPTTAVFLSFFFSTKRAMFSCGLCTGVFKQAECGFACKPPLVRLQAAAGSPASGWRLAGELAAACRRTSASSPTRRR